jgi:cellulose biosynthesis protein BcsQ
MSSVAVYSPKGGAGKSSIAVNLAHLSASANGRTLLWDIDAQGAAGFLVNKDRCGTEAGRMFARKTDPAALIAPTGYPQLDLLAADTSLRRLDFQLIESAARKRLRKLLRGLESEYRWIVLDCPPGVSEVSEQVFRAVDLVVIPVQPSPLSMRAYQEALHHIRWKYPGGPDILPVLSMVDVRRKLHREVLAAHPRWHAIPQASAVERMSVERAPVATFAPRHPATLAFLGLWADVKLRLCAAERSAKARPDQ